MARVFVITGPSGVGKGTLIAALRKRMPDLELSVSATTRKPRRGECNDREYHFLTEDEFEARVQHGDFAEHAHYSGNRYGTLRVELEHRLATGRPVVLEVEMQGARQLRMTVPDAVQIFIKPPNEEELRTRLTDRGTDSPTAVAKRLETARTELAAQEEFSHIVLNDRFEDAVEALELIIRKCVEKVDAP